MLPMFKNNSYIDQSHNYSFQKDQDNSKQAHFSLPTHPTFPTSQKKVGKNPTIQKLQSIQKFLIKHYQLQKQNKQILKQQQKSINKIQQQLIKLNNILSNHINNQQINYQYNKLSSNKTKRSKKFQQNTLPNYIQKRQKIINQQLTKRINYQLDFKQQKKPLKFFIPNDYAIL